MTAYLLERAWLPLPMNPTTARGATTCWSRWPRGASPASSRRARRRWPSAVPGLTVPGLANAHSHAFHRALRGRTQRERGTFWTWREQMYAVAARLDPDSLLRAGAGDATARWWPPGSPAWGSSTTSTTSPTARRTPTPTRWVRPLVGRAREAGIRITLLDTCYLSAGFGAAPEGVQVRYCDGDADAWAARRAALSPGDGVVVGAAIHSVRAVPRDQLPTVVAAAEGAPLHVHLSEQVAENDACLAAYGVTPTRLLADAGALGPGDQRRPRHPPHRRRHRARSATRGATPASARPPSATSATASARAAALAEAGARLTLGSDSHAVIDPFEEMRAVELDERLATQQRGHWTAAELLAVGDRCRPRLARLRRRGAIARRGSAPTWSPSTRRARAPPAPAPTRPPWSSPRAPPTSPG